MAASSNWIRTLPFHGRDYGFESRRGCQFKKEYDVMVA